MDILSIRSIHMLFMHSQLDPEVRDKGGNGDNPYLLYLRHK